MNYPSHPHRRPAMPLVARAAHAATAAYQRAMTSKRERLHQQEIYQLRQENAWLRNEVRHCWDAIDGMGHDMEVRRQEFVLGELSRVNARRRTAVVDQRRLLEVHLREQLAAELEGARREGWTEGYAAGVATLASPGEPVSESATDRRAFYWQVYADVMRDLWDLE